MQNDASTLLIGNVLRADIRGFVVASRIPAPQVPTFGAFVRASIQQGQADLIGLVYDIRLQDDPFFRNLAAAAAQDDPRYAEVIRDQRENRTLPVEIAVVAVGYRDQAGYHYGLPPQPPMLLNRIVVCDGDEVRAITAAPDFIRPLLDARDVPGDELIPRALEAAARLREGSARQDFLLAAGRYLARNLGRETARLERLLRRLSELQP